MRGIASPWNTRIRLTAAALLFLLGIQGCQNKKTVVVPASLSERCVVVTPAETSGKSRGWQMWLDQYMPHAQRFPLDQLAGAVEACRQSDLVLVLAGIELTPEQRQTIEDYLIRGTRLLALGREHPLATSSRTGIMAAIGLDQAPFRLEALTWQVAGETTPVDLSPREAVCTLPGPRGYGGERAPSLRWIPVVEARGPNGKGSGWPGSVWLVPQSEEGYSVCGWLGGEAEREDGEQWVPMMTAMIRHMTRDAYLLRFGMDRFSAPGQMPLRAVARMNDRRTRDLSPLRLVVEWVNRHGQDIRRHVSPPLDNVALSTVLNIGLAPEPTSGQPEAFRIRLLIRDRNDQRTYDQVEQVVKIIPSSYKSTDIERISVQGGQLGQGRRPIFMLGVNYWPRLSRGPGDSYLDGHWLDPEQFDPEVLGSDLDLMASSGINSIAIEYTDISQAPQLVYVLEELRRRTMWAQAYIPALYPFDVRMDDAFRLLEALPLENWPELYALEMARGLAVKSRADLRRLDVNWADWLDEHFSSVTEAEQKLGASLWRERGKVAGPPDAQLQWGPHRDRAISLYYVFLRDFACRRMGYIRRSLREKDYTTLLTVRSSYGWPDDPPENIIDILDIATGSIHQDFLSADAWTIHPLRTMHNDGDIMAAYVRGMGGGKPVVWSAYGQYVGTEGKDQTAQRQKEVYKHFLDMFLRQGAGGAYAWRYPANPADSKATDWGLVAPSGIWRPVEESFRAARLRLRQSRPQAPTPVRQTAPLVQSAGQWRDEQARRSGIFSQSPAAAKVTEWIMPGAGIESPALLDPAQVQRWSEIEGLHMLNTEWGQVRIAGALQDRLPGESVKIYAGRPLEMEIINSGSVRWVGAAERKAGSVWIRVSQPGFPDEWIATTPLDRGGRQIVKWQPRDPGLWELQAFLVGYGKFGERLRIEATTPPRLF